MLPPPPTAPHLQGSFARHRAVRHRKCNAPSFNEVEWIVGIYEENCVSRRSGPQALASGHRERLCGKCELYFSTC